MEIFKKLYIYLRKKILPIETIIGLIPNNSIILDLGCGRGIILKSLTNFKKYVGVDTNTENPTKSKGKVVFIKEDCVEFIKRDLKNYNVFVIIDLIHHVKKSEQELFLNNLINNMKGGDLLIVKDINPTNIITKYWNLLHDLLISKQLINYFDFKKLQKNHSKNFEIKTFYKKIFFYDHYFFVLKK
tara:strand:- start:839 stop:1396 length:558 start_codon:yes stop_codon:yes gene_type:complete